MNWILNNKRYIIIGIILLITLSLSFYSYKSGKLNNIYEKFIDSQVQIRLKEYKDQYEKDKIAADKQIKQKETEIVGQEKLIGQQEKIIGQQQRIIKDSDKKVNQLYQENEILKKKLETILVPKDTKETRERLRGLGFETCN
jgi:protein subunit release factor A